MSSCSGIFELCSVHWTSFRIHVCWVRGEVWNCVDYRFVVPQTVFHMIGLDTLEPVKDSLVPEWVNWHKKRVQREQNIKVKGTVLYFFAWLLFIIGLFSMFVSMQQQFYCYWTLKKKLPFTVLFAFEDKLSWASRSLRHANFYSLSSSDRHDNSFIRSAL